MTTTVNLPDIELYEGGVKLATVDDIGDSGFYAVYGTTTFATLLEHYNDNEKIYLALSDVETIPLTGEYTSELSGGVYCFYFITIDRISDSDDSFKVRYYICDSTNGWSVSNKNVLLPVAIASDSGKIISVDNSGNYTLSTNAVANSLTFGNKTYNGSTAQTILASDLGLSQAMTFKGTTTTVLTDGCAVTSIVISGTTYTVSSTTGLGWVVIYNKLEFVWTGSIWEQLGQAGSFALDSAVVHNTTDETVAGVKTFSSSPIVPTPTTDMQASTKKYVDDGLADKQDTISDLATIRNNASAGAAKVSCTDATVEGFGYTKNIGTITGITMNSASKGTSGVVDLGTVITAHQDISGKENTSNKTTSLSSSSTDTQYPSAKCVYDIIGNVVSALNALM